MLTASQEIVISYLAQQIISKTGQAFATKPIARTSVRYENGQRKTSDFSAPFNATGSLIKSLRFEIVGTTLVIYANDYVHYLVYGRGPTGSGGGNGSVKSEILRWVRAKGIKPSDDITESQLVFLITRKIHREGSSIFLKHGHKDYGLLNTILTSQLQDDFNGKFTAQIVKELNESFDAN